MKYDAKKCIDCGDLFFGRSLRCKSCIKAFKRKYNTTYVKQHRDSKKPERHCTVCGKEIPRKEHGKVTVCRNEECRNKAHEQYIKDHRDHINERTRYRAKNDPDFKKRMLAANAKYIKRRYHSDPEFRAKRLEASRKSYRKRKVSA